MIKVKDLWKSYGNNQVLKGLSLDIAQGEILAILGRSGIGKSVLLRQIIGLEKPDKGSIEIDGTNICDLSEIQLYHHIKNMGMLFQGAALFDSLNIEENTGFYFRNHADPQTGKRLSKVEIKERVIEALKMVGLDGIEDQSPSDLSGGMKKRAGLARLIAYRPKILLYDEPTTGLDPITAGQINELIIKTQEELQGTSIIVTHDMHSALFVADRLALHQDGKITHIADPKTFLDIDEPNIKYLKNTLTNHPLMRKETHK
jgi:phospholipid/cholesterol/gamma-HCH transport system ATP-binding protein